MEFRELIEFVARKVLCPAAVLLLVSYSLVEAAIAQSPNIVVILADDLGYSDIGCYGGEIETPNLDQLASRGMRMTRCYNGGMCVVSRASLLSGKWWPQALASLSESELLPARLNRAGYQSGLIGKWHLEGHPMDHGFDHFFGFLSGFADHFEGTSSYRLDREPFNDFGDDFYSTDDLTDRAIDFIAANKTKPYYLQLSYQAPHNPLQARRSDIEKYRGKYLGGWQSVREARFARQKQMGLVAKDAVLPDYPQNLPAWESLTPEQRDLEDLRMAVYAAMVDRMDHAVGRLNEAIQASGKADNTLVIFVSDNGTDSFSVVDDAMLKRGLLPGDRRSNWQPGTGWAYASVTPWRLYKISQHGGGVATGAIVSWPAVIKNEGAISDAPVHFVDFLPTLTQAAGVKGLSDRLAGQSFLPLLAGQSWQRTEPMFFQYMDNRAVRGDRWTLAEVDGAGWELYDTKKDALEIHDVSKSQPEIVKHWSEKWQAWWNQQSDTTEYVPKSTVDSPHYRPQGDRGSGRLYSPSAMPRELADRYPVKSKGEPKGDDQAAVAPISPIDAYLDASFDHVIEDVAVEADAIKITGRSPGPGASLFLGDVPIEAPTNQGNAFRALVPVAVNQDGGFSMEVPRFVDSDGNKIDRLHDRWQLFKVHDGVTTAVSHRRYADDVACRSPELPEVKPATKKGLGGWSPHRAPTLVDELDTLGIDSVTVNVSAIHQLVSDSPGEGHVAFQWQGRTLYANERRLRQYDSTFLKAAERGAMVSAILLVSNPARPEADSAIEAAKRLAHPEVDASAKYAMPNVTSPESIVHYGAILNVMAERWSRPDGKFGRVHQWIVHNEVDVGWVWTNAGSQTAIEYMDLYHRSLRMVDLIVRQHDPHARAWVSLTHHWAKPGPPEGYGSRQMLELLARFCDAEGDFPWALAFHPYPQDLRQPRTWEDDQATKGFDTDKITPRNLEVLDAYMKRPEMRYRGEVRPVHLSENGFNSPDYSDESLRDQAAGMALAWIKVQSLSSVKVWHYHNWIDNRHEGGLRIGLRRYSDDAEQPLGTKPVWSLYQALGTPAEAEALKPYLQVIGIGT